MKITRKQAVLRAIEILSKSKENQEICKVLQELLDELPLSHWTEKSLKDSIEQFLLENNRLPNSEDYLTNKNLPSRCTIKSKTGLSMEEYYNKYYSNFYYNNNSIYNHKEIEHWVELFKEQYIKHDKPGLNTFDKLRDEGTPCVQTYCKIIGISTWNELLEYCGFEVIGQNRYSKARPKHKTNFCVECEFNIDNLDLVKIQELQNTINKINTNTEE